MDEWDRIVGRGKILSHSGHLNLIILQVQQKPDV
jgi:hypothetical protein